MNFEPEGETIHNDLLATKALVYDPGQYELTDYRADVESAEYAACAFKLNEISICFRVAKTTPLKTGQFVTLWKRNGTGPIQPFDSSGGFDFYVVSTRNATRFGQFVFPQPVLRDRDILSDDGQGGKRAIRVYSSFGCDDEQASPTDATLAVAVLSGDPS